MQPMPYLKDMSGAAVKRIERYSIFSIFLVLRLHPIKYFQSVIAVKQPETGKLFVVFLSENGKVKIPKGKKVAAIYKTDDLFIENGDAANELIPQSNALIPKGTDYLGKGYIINSTSLK